MKVTDYVHIFPEDLDIGDIVCDAFIMWHFDSNAFMNGHKLGKGFSENHVAYGKYLFHHTLKGFELIDNNYTR